MEKQPEFNSKYTNHLFEIMSQVEAPPVELMIEIESQIQLLADSNNQRVLRGAKDDYSFLRILNSYNSTDTTIDYRRNFDIKNEFWKSENKLMASRIEIKIEDILNQGSGDYVGIVTHAILNREGLIFKHGFYWWRPLEVLANGNFEEVNYNKDTLNSSTTTGYMTVFNAFEVQNKLDECINALQPKS